VGVAVGGAVVVVVLGVALDVDGLGAAPVGAAVCGTLGGAAVHPATSAPARTSPEVRRGIPIP
jgi:hypothetical protein